MAKTKKRITFEEARKLYPDEWVVLSEPRIDRKNTRFIDGIVYYHGQDRQTAFARAKELKGGGAIDYTGEFRYRKVNLRVDEVGKAAA